MRPRPAFGLALPIAICLVAFAANSVICRFALRHSQIDAASFTVIRIASAAATLLVMLRLRRDPTPDGSTVVGWTGAVALAIYASAFAFAYAGISTGAGALLLFGAVQLTMLGYGFATGERLRATGLIGLALALGGLVYLLLPGASAPPAFNAVLMIVSGVAWGLYSLRGRGARDPLAATTGNFVRAVPLSVLFALPFLDRLNLDPEGVALALVSGCIASSASYVVWYGLLRRIASVQAATLQLAVPVIAAIAGVLLVGEPWTMRLAISSVAVLGGVAIVLNTRAPA